MRCFRAPQNQLQLKWFLKPIISVPANLIVKYLSRYKEKTLEGTTERWWFGSKRVDIKKWLCAASLSFFHHGSKIYVPSIGNLSAGQENTEERNTRGSTEPQYVFERASESYEVTGKGKDRGTSRLLVHACRGVSAIRFASITITLLIHYEFEEEEDGEDVSGSLRLLNASLDRFSSRATMSSPSFVLVRRGGLRPAIIRFISALYSWLWCRIPFYGRYRALDGAAGQNTEMASLCRPYEKDADVSEFGLEGAALGTSRA
ncbi:hypothetical protein FB451DRAFT_1195072 [Mycena latifolia]|nr:hypothetical protein FB451DRAFT_1195072 [Mycena latifolia]